MRESPRKEGDRPLFLAGLPETAVDGVAGLREPEAGGRLVQGFRAVTQGLGVIFQVPTDGAGFHGVSMDVLDLLGNLFGGIRNPLHRSDHLFHIARQ